MPHIPKNFAKYSKTKTVEIDILITAYQKRGTRDPGPGTRELGPNYDHMGPKTRDLVSGTRDLGPLQWDVNEQLTSLKV